MLGAIGMLNRLELAGETLRAALAVTAPGWLAGVIDESWQQVYRARIDDLHLPAGQAGRQDLMVRYGTDGYFLLDQVHGPGAPAWLRELPAVQALRRIWIQQYCREVTGGRQEVRRREKLPGGRRSPARIPTAHLPAIFTLRNTIGRGCPGQDPRPARLGPD